MIKLGILTIGAIREGHSQVCLGWLAQNGGDMEVLAPPSIDLSSLIPRKLLQRGTIVLGCSPYSDPPQSPVGLFSIQLC